MEEKILAALAQLNGKFDTMQSDMAEMKADIAGLKTDVAGLKADMAEVKAEQKSMKADIAELKTDVAGLKTDVASLKKEQEGMAAQLHENHMLLTAVREAQDVQGAELDRLNIDLSILQFAFQLLTKQKTNYSNYSSKCSHSSKNSVNYPADPLKVEIFLLNLFLSKVSYSFYTDSIVSNCRLLPFEMLEIGCFATTE